MKILIPDIAEWFHREYGEITYEPAQALVGHGRFQKYLYKICNKITPTCVLCESGKEDDVNHFSDITDLRNTGKTNVLGQGNRAHMETQMRHYR